MTDDLRRLVDTQAIRDLLARYVRAVDRGDLEDLREVYHPDAVDEHGGYTGGVDGLIDHIAARIGDAPQAMHLLGQCLVEFAPGDDVAVAETYYMTATTPGPAIRDLFSPDGAAVQMSAFGRYVDRLERRDGRWWIVHRVVVVEATRVVTGEAPSMTGGAPASRAGDDPVHRLRAAAGIG